MQKIPRPAMMGPCTETAQLVTELQNSSVSIHQLHLKITGPGSYAAHNALGGYYEGITDLIDNVTEQYQGAREKLLTFPSVDPVKLNTTTDALSLLRDLYNKTTELQKLMPFSEVTNQLDEVKSLIAATKYKLLFLS